MIASRIKCLVIRYLMVAIGLLAAPDTIAAIVSYAQVRPDATLLVGSRVVRLFGVFVPALERTCETRIRPVKCGSNAVLALEFKIRGFLKCQQIYRHRDRSVTALCMNRGVDLGAYLIERGWAVALPNAPFEYHVLERIARTRSMGMWGLTGIALPPSSGRP